MSVDLKIEVEMGSDRKAEAVFRALEVDDDGFLRTVRKGSTIICHVSSQTVQGARRAADDWLACLVGSMR